jgi:hypothetical protein
LTWCDLVDLAGPKIIQMTDKNIVQLQKSRHCFFKYWNNNMLDRLESTQVNLSNLLHRSWDPDNPVESKKKVMQPNVERWKWK